MKHLLFALLAAAILLAGCRKETAVTTSAPPPRTVTTTDAAPPKDLRDAKIDVKIPLEPPQVVSECRVGATLDKAGVVAAEKTEFKAGERVHMTLFLNEAPNELVVRARAFDKNEKEVTVAQKPAEGVKNATLILRPLKRGRYTIEGVWGGNVVCTEEIVVK